MSWENDGSQSPHERLSSGGDAALTAPPTAAEEASADDGEFSIKAHVAQEGGKAAVYLHGLLWNLQMYVDGVCPDNRWFFAYKSGPSLLAVQEVVRHQLDALSEDPFRRVSPRRSTQAVPGVPVERDGTPSPICSSLYTAALLPPGALQALESRERAAAASRGVPYSQRLVRARALLEDVANSPKPRKARASWADKADRLHAAGSSSEKPSITAKEVLMATELLEHEHAEDSSTRLLPGSASALKPLAESFWNVLSNQPRRDPPGRSTGFRVGGLSRVVKEERRPIFSAGCVNRPFGGTRSVKPPLVRLRALHASQEKAGEGYVLRLGSVTAGRALEQVLLLIAKCFIEAAAALISNSADPKHDSLDFQSALRVLLSPNS
ncbi:hypothetical protein Efla_004349 [Eimeria flavescens]